MKIGIHQEPSGPGLGGSELVSAVLANMFRTEHDVELVHHRAWLTRDEWSKFAATDLADVGLRRVAIEGRPFGEPGTPLGLWPGARLRSWMAHLSEPYDLFVTVTHNPPPYCHASHGVLYSLFPKFDRHNEWLWSGKSRGFLGPIKDYVRRTAHERLWRQRMNSYESRWAISEYAARWTAKRWGTKCEVIAPPVHLSSQGVRKERRVVMLGRFVRDKQHDRVITAFLSALPKMTNWELILIGGLSEDSADQDYYRELQLLAGGAPVRLCPNVERFDLIEMLRTTDLFVHAMGYGVDEATVPEAIEHFGIATVEAMAAGCVPLVINRGGQIEIVRNGIDGLHWGTLEQLTDQLVQLGNDPASRQRLRESAIARSVEYGRDRFADRVRKSLDHILVN